MTCTTIDGPAGAGPRWVRTSVQIGFLVFSLLIGWQFHGFVLWLSDPVGPPLERPPSVEAWLPISSLMSLTYLCRTGLASPVHPAGLVIFSLILVLTLLAGRGFCSWVCPIGTLSEGAHRIGRKVFSRNLSLPRWLDIPLRALKYLLLGFFVYAILGMTGEAPSILESPYNRIADVKMYLLIAEITRITAIVLAVLFSLSVLIRNFWCRYLCPYGALLALCSWLSPIAVRRDTGSCTGCRRCDKACPNLVRVSTHQRVRSLECTTCFRCVQACETPGALAVSWPTPRRTVSGPVYAAVLVGAFILVPQAARSIGYWKSNTSPGLYAALYKFVRQAEHPQTPQTLSDGRSHSLSPGFIEGRATEESDSLTPRER